MIFLLSAFLRAFLFQSTTARIAFGRSFYWKSVNKFHLVSKNNAMNHKVSKFLLYFPWWWLLGVVKTNSKWKSSGRKFCGSIESSSISAKCFICSRMWTPQTKPRKEEERKDRRSIASRTKLLCLKVTWYWRRKQTPGKATTESYLWNVLRSVFRIQHLNKSLITFLHRFWLVRSKTQFKSLKFEILSIHLSL